MKKDELSVLNYKKQMIEEIKKIDKTTMFQVEPKKKVSILSKILKVLGYGKKR